MRMHGWKTHVPYERKIRSSWRRRCLVKHRKPWSNWVSGQFIVLLWKLTIYCDYTIVISALIHTIKTIDLYPNLVFWFGIGWYFPGIFPTNTKGKLGWDVLVLYIWREPLFSLKGRLLPPFWWIKPPFWGKNKFLPNLQKGGPAKFQKMELPPKLTVQKIPTEYQPASAGNLPIPAKLPLNRWSTTLQN